MTSLSRIMAEMGVTTIRLAEMTELPKRSIDNYRQGRTAPTLEVGLKIADALGVDPHQLVEPHPEG